MGGTGSICNVYNKSNFTNVRVKINGVLVDSLKNLIPNHSIQIPMNEDTNFQVQILNAKDKVVKKVSFSSKPDVSWVIRSDGVTQQKYGESLSVKDPEGSFHPWEEEIQKIMQIDKKPSANKNNSRRLRMEKVIANENKKTRKVLGRRIKKSELTRIKSPVKVKRSSENQISTQSLSFDSDSDTDTNSDFSKSKPESNIDLKQRFQESHEYIREFEDYLTDTFGKPEAISQIYKIMSGKQTADKAELCEFFQIIMDRGDFYDPSIIDRIKQPKDWAVHLLMAEIAGRAITEDSDHQTLIENALQKLHNYYAGHNSGLEIVLQFVINKQKTQDLNDVKDIARILNLLQISPRTIKEALNSSDWLDKLKSRWLVERLTQGNQKIYSLPDLKAELKKFWTIHEESVLKDDFEMTEALLFRCNASLNNIHEINVFLSRASEQDIMNKMISNIELKKLEEKQDEEFLNRVSEKFSGNEKCWLLQDLIKKLCQGDNPPFSISAMKLLCEHLDDSGDENFKNMLSILSTLSDFKLSESEDGPHIALILQTSSPAPGESAQCKIFAYCCQKYDLMEQKSEKSVDILIQEIQDMNSNSISHPKIQSIKSIYESIVKKFENFTSSWNAEMIKTWTTSFKLLLCKLDHSKYVCEILPVLMQCVKLSFGYVPRPIQILTLLFILEGENSKGRLAKVSTGEGKSLTVAMLAAMKNLQGSTVDIVTSSPVLAQRDCKTFQNFYSMLNITSGDVDSETENFDENLKKAKPCYSANIVYGTTSGFEGDILRHEFSRLNTRGTRGFGVVIVDEVDSMFIDEGEHSTKLVDGMPGMEHMNHVFALIWNSLNGILATFLQIDGATFTIGESYGPESQILEAILKVLPQVTRQKFGLVTTTDLIASVQKFAMEVKMSERNSEVRRNEVERLINSFQENPWLEEWLPNTFKMWKDNSNNIQELIDQCIEEKWSMLDYRNHLSILRFMLNANIQFYELNPESKLVEESSKYNYKFHIHEDVKIMQEYYKNENKKNNLPHFDIKFYISTVPLSEGQTSLESRELIYLEKIEDRTNYIEKRVETIMKDFVVFANNSSAKAEKTEKLKVQLPTHLNEMYKRKLNIWIGGAIKTKFEMEENRDYVIKKNSTDGQYQIIPVDFLNTGVVQEETMWSDGIHQFLQMKHKLALTPEYLTTNYLSNMGFFQRYGSRIFGLTGTLGTEQEINLLQKLYQVDTIQIPVFKPKRHFQMDPILSIGNQNEWLGSICNSIHLETKRQRAVLIICNTIKEAVQIESELKSGFSNSISISLYTRSDETCGAALSNPLQPRTVIVATNLAGRGMDLKLSPKVLAQGGLHVCLTFLPTNARVEEQAIGRASRQGEPGTSQLIILEPNANANSVQNIRTHRDENHAVATKDIETRVVQDLSLDESLFNSYCQLRNKCLPNPEEKSKTSKEDPGLNRYIEAMDERWAQKLDAYKSSRSKNPATRILTNSTINATKKEFDGFFRTLEAEFKKRTVIQNPFYFLLLGQDLIFAEDFAKAIEMFTLGIRQEKSFAEQFYYYRAYCYIVVGKEDCKQKALLDLQISLDLIQERIIPDYLSLYLLVENKNLENRGGKTNLGSPFCEQITKKIEFYQIQSQSIADAINELNSTKGEVQVRMIPFSDLYNKNGKPEPIEELKELRTSGAIAFFKVEKKPLPWWTVPAIFLLGVVQMVAGAALSVTGIGLSVGAGMILEGISDIWTGIEVLKTGEFSWKEWTVQKFVGIVMLVFLAGVGKGIRALSSLLQATSRFVIKTIVKPIGSSRAFSYLARGVQYLKGKVKLGPDSGLRVVNNKVKEILLQLKTIFDTARQKVMKRGRRIGNRIFRKNPNVVIEAQVEIQKGILSLEQKKMAVLGGKQIGHAIVQSGIMTVIDATIFKPIGDLIEKSLLSTVENLLTTELKSEGALGIQITKMLSAPMSISEFSEVKQTIESLGNEAFNSFDIWDKVKDNVSKVSNRMIQEIKDCLKEESSSENGITSKTWYKILMSSFKQVWSTALAVRQCNQLVPKFCSDLLQRLESQAKEKPETKKPCNENDGVIPKEKLAISIGAFKKSLMTKWSVILTKMIRGKIEENILKKVTRPMIEDCIEKATGKKALEKQIALNAAEVRTNREINKQSKGIGNWRRPKDLQEFPETDQIEFKKFLQDKKNMFVEAGAECYPAITNLTNRPIERYVELPNGQIVWDKTFGQTAQNKNCSPHRILYRPPKTGTPGHYDALEKTREGITKVVDLSQHRVNGNNCLFEALLYTDNKSVTPKNVRRLRAKVTNYMENHPQFYIKNVIKSKHLKLVDSEEKNRILNTGGAKRAEGNLIRYSDYFKKELKEQTQAVQDEVSKIETELRRLGKQELTKRIQQTNKEATDAQDYYRIHSLHGLLSGYFTVDVRVHNQHRHQIITEERAHNSPGVIRLIAKAKFHKGDVSNIQLRGFCDDHSSKNVMAWNNVPQNARNDFLQLRNSTDEYVGVRNVRTRRDYIDPEGIGANNIYFNTG